MGTPAQVVGSTPLQAVGWSLGQMVGTSLGQRVRSMGHWVGAMAATCKHTVGRSGKMVGHGQFSGGAPAGHWVCVSGQVVTPGGQAVGRSGQRVTKAGHLVTTV